MWKALPALLIAVVLAGPQGASAAGVKLATGNGYPPFAGEGLPEGGLATAIVRAAYAARDIPVEIAFLPWRRGYRMTGEGEFDGTFPYVETAERKAKFLYSDPIFVIRERPVVPADSDLRVDSFDDLRGKRFCAPYDFALAPPIQEMTDAGTLDLVRPSKLTNCMEMLGRGRIDFLPLAEPIALRTALKALGSTRDIRMEPLVIREHELALIFPKNQEGSAERLETFNAAIRTLHDSGEYQKIVKRHLH